MTFEMTRAGRTWLPETCSPITRSFRLKAINSQLTAATTLSKGVDGDPQGDTINAQNYKGVLRLSLVIADDTLSRSEDITLP